MRKRWYDLVGKSQIELKKRSGGRLSHLTCLAGKDILVLLLPYLEGTYVRDLIAYDIIDAACNIDYNNGIFKVVTWPTASDLFTFDLYLDVSRPTNEDRQRFLDSAAWSIAFSFLYLEEDLYKQCQKELVCL